MDCDEGGGSMDMSEPTKTTVIATDVDSDDDRPQIFLRDFSEIREQDSDCDEEILILEEITVDPGIVTGSTIQSSIPPAKTHSKKDIKAVTRARLEEMVTFDDSLADVEMTFESSPAIVDQLRHQVTEDSLSSACIKLSSWLRRQLSFSTKSESPSNADTIVPPSKAQKSVRNKPIRGRTVARGSSSTVNQPIHHAYPSVTTSHISYNSPRQPVLPVSGMPCSPRYYAPGTATGAHPVTALWQLGGRQGVQNRQSPHVQLPPGFEPTHVVGNVSNNIQSPLSQLRFDPATGCFLCPTNNKCQEPGTQPQSTTVRIQNGKIVRPSDAESNCATQVHRCRMETSRNTGSPQAPSMQRMHLNVTLPTNNPSGPFRIMAPTPQTGPTATYRFVQPSAPSANGNIVQPCILTSQQQNLKTPVGYTRVPFAVPAQVPGASGPIQATGCATPSVSVQINVTAGNQKAIPGTIEESNSGLDNKTFPSLVVLVKTCIATKPPRQAQLAARSSLDDNVKTILSNTPTKFTEWLLRRGLLQLAPQCTQHRKKMFKLGLYSDPSKQPFSGGYVWTADCCPNREISVFNGSIFEGSKYPPGTVLKLMYHWACQTPAQNILQWVKVSSLFLKNFFIVLRAICTSILHEQCPPLGGESKFVEIGVITLGSTAETSRGVKHVSVEILGVFDPATKIIRMKIINSMQSHLLTDKGKKINSESEEQGARAFQILWPLMHWVDKRSVLLVDGIIDRVLLEEVGFRNFQSCGYGGQSTATNANVMNYLRNLVPQMFSNTLSVLSKNLVQQFLDELSWREMYGQTVLTCYDNLLDHVGCMTKWDLQGESLITRLNNINRNPFLDWSLTKRTRRCPMNTVPLNFRNEPGIRECIRYVMKETGTQPVLPKPPFPAPSQQKTAQKRKNATYQHDVNKSYYNEIYNTAAKLHSLQTYYYGSLKADETATVKPQPFPQNLKCPMCTRTFSTYIEICSHICTHINGVTYRLPESSVCRICLKELSPGVTMPQHIHMVHILDSTETACRICEEKFKTEQELVIHMWDLHHKREAPYRCRICNYASSFHFDVIQHYQEKHGNNADVLCPLCLKIFVNCVTTGPLQLVVNHLQAHFKFQRRRKKCPRCVLSFISDVDLELHLADHCSQEQSPKWIPYLLPPNESDIKMATPPPSKSPLCLSPLASIASSTTYSVPPPTKKQKLLPPTTFEKYNKLSLNAVVAVPIERNEKFGGSKYKIAIPSFAAGLCVECGDDINKPDHFIGKLICSKCRYSTACNAAMNLHHDKNHQPVAQSVKPVMKTAQVQELNQVMYCKCGFFSSHPTRLAKHLTSCEKFTVYTTLASTAENPIVGEISQMTSSPLPLDDTRNRDESQASTLTAQAVPIIPSSSSI